MSRRLLPSLGPLATSALVLAACLVLSSRFDVGSPPARGVPADLIAWLSLGATLMVVLAWLVAARWPRRKEQ